MSTGETDPSEVEAGRRPGASAPAAPGHVTFDRRELTRILASTAARSPRANGAITHRFRQDRGGVLGLPPHSNADLPHRERPARRAAQACTG